MEIEFREDTFDDEDVYFSPTIDGKKTNCFFANKYEALIYAGLHESGISKNDASSLSRFIVVMLNGLKKDEK